MTIFYIDICGNLQNAPSNEMNDYSLLTGTTSTGNIVKNPVWMAVNIGLNKQLLQQNSLYHTCFPATA